MKHFFSVFFSLLLFIHLIDCQKCPNPNDQVPNEDVCMFSVNQTEFYLDVVRGCATFGGIPAKIQNRFENAFIYSYILQYELGDVAPFIGIERKKNNVWVYADGSPLTYQNWAPGQPSNLSNSSACVLMDTQTGRWQSAECYYARPYICSMNVATEPSTEKPPLTSEPIIAKDCDEVPGPKIDGVYPILISGQIVQVYCSFGSNVALTHIQGRGEKDSTDFAVTFEKYKSTFGNPDKGNNFWLGLDNINQLTVKNGQSYSLMIEVCCGSASISKQYYTDVKVNDSSSGYVLTGKATLNIGLSYVDVSNGYGADFGRKFVTYDSWTDSTGDNEYCLVINDGNNYRKGSGGWWFGNCRENLNGYYYKAIDLDVNCKIIANFPWTNGSGIEFVTQNVSKPIVNGVSYTRARMAIYRGSAQPVGLANFCI